MRYRWLDWTRWNIRYKKYSDARTRANATVLVTPSRLSPSPPLSWARSSWSPTLPIARPPAPGPVVGVVGVIGVVGVLFLLEVRFSRPREHGVVEDLVRLVQTTRGHAEHHAREVLRAAPQLVRQGQAKLHRLRRAGSRLAGCFIFAQARLGSLALELDDGHVRLLRQCRVNWSAAGTSQASAGAGLGRRRAGRARRPRGEGPERRPPSPRRKRLPNASGSAQSARRARAVSAAATHATAKADRESIVGMCAKVARM